MSCHVTQHKGIIHMTETYVWTMATFFKTDFLWYVCELTHVIFCLCVWEQNQLVFFSQMHLWIAVVFERVCVCACAQAYVASFSATALNFANASVFWHDYLKVTLCVRKLLPFQTIMSKRFAHLRQDEDCTHVCVSVSVWCVSVCVRLHPDSMSL